MENQEMVREKSWNNHGKIFCQVCGNPDNSSDSVLCTCHNVFGMDLKILPLLRISII